MSTSGMRMLSAVVIVLELAWKPRSAKIVCENSRQGSTLDISSAPGMTVPKRYAPGIFAPPPQGW
jgi:hypothetical protein